MFDLDLSNVMEKSLDALWLRQKVISNNIVNADTPGYKSKSVEFEELLTKALNSNSDKKVIPQAKIVTNEDVAVREDGNSVDIDRESLELYRVQIQYEYMVKKITDELSNIRLVLTEGRG